MMQKNGANLGIGTWTIATAYGRHLDVNGVAAYQAVQFETAVEAGSCVVLNGHC
jgi:hypothetical protein